MTFILARNQLETEHVYVLREIGQRGIKYSMQFIVPLATEEEIPSLM